MNIIGLTGAIGSGKDLASVLIKEELEQRYGISKEIYKFARPLKDFSAAVFGFSEADLEDRKLKEKSRNVTLDKVEFETTLRAEIRKIAKAYLQRIGAEDLDTKLDRIEETLVVRFHVIFNQYKKPYWWPLSLLKRSKVRYRVSPRIVTQKVGTELFREGLSQDVWTAIAPYQDAIINDVRFPNEAQYVLNNNGIIFKIINASQKGGPSKTSNHISEKFLDQIEYQYVIHNSGTSIDQLKQEVQDLLEEVYNEERKARIES